MRSPRSIGYAAMQCPLSDPKDLGCPAFVIADLTERELDVGSFHFIQGRALAEFEYGSHLRLRSGEAHLRNTQSWWELMNLQGAFASHDHHPLQDVAQFPDIARPGMAHQSG